VSKLKYIPYHHRARHDCSHDNGPLIGDVDQTLDGYVDVASHAHTLWPDAGIQATTDSGRASGAPNQSPEPIGSYSGNPSRGNRVIPVIEG
jgi:hypothetical protein